MILRSILGIAVLTAVLWLFSSNKKAINWWMVVKGLGLQIILALLVLKVPGVSWAFEKFSLAAVTLLDFTREGSTFLFGSLITDTPDGEKSFGYLFAFPSIAHGHLLLCSHLLIILLWNSPKSGESHGLGHAENTSSIWGRIARRCRQHLHRSDRSALAGKPYIAKMSRSELLSLMAGGMATIAGGVLAAYIGYLGGDDPERQLFFAKHLLTASVLSAPAALISAKILYYLKLKTVEEVAEISSQDMGSNALDAISNGTTEGVKLAVNVGAMLFVFTALVYGVNYLFVEGIGSWTGLNAWTADFTNGRYDTFSLQFIMGALIEPYRMDS